MLDWRKLIGTVAPALATALGGPLAGVATSAISTAILGKPDGTEPEIADALAIGGADALVKIREADRAFQTRLAELGIDLERIHAQDRDSARLREVRSGDNWTPRVLAAVVVGGFLFTVYMVLSGFVAGLKDPSIAGLVGTLIGYVSAKADQVVSYYFGSSAGSKEKNEMLARK